MGGERSVLRYALLDTPLGLVLLAATPRGARFLGLGDDEAALLAELARDVPGAAARDDDALAEWAASVRGYLSGGRGLDLPLDVVATPFQARVWAALQAIPYGETRTYTALAAEIGAPPGAARAVGRACATNPVSLAIPCHRAVRGDGQLAGYRWGLQRKRALLDMERRIAEADRSSGAG